MVILTSPLEESTLINRTTVSYNVTGRLEVLASPMHSSFFQWKKSVSSTAGGEF